MLEVVFGDSVKGSMKLAKAGGAAALGRIGEPGGDVAALSAAVPVGADSGGVVCIGFALDVGDISGGMLGAGRRAAYDLLWGRFERSGGAAERERYFAGLERDLQKLMDTAHAGGPVRIWVDRAPHSACGFYAVCDALRDADCPVWIVELPEQELAGPDTLRRCSGWGEVEPSRLMGYAGGARELRPVEKRARAAKWRELAEQNAPLRAVVNGVLMSVKEDFYDCLIERHMPEGEFVMARLIGDIMGKNPIGVSDGWYACRIGRMVEAGRLRVVRRDEARPYGAILEKAK